jgi:hypothetical protein
MPLSPLEDKSLICGIYTITHIESGKVYVGSSVHVNERCRVHRNLLNLKKHHNPYLQNACGPAVLPER